MFDIISIGNATKDVFIEIHPKVFKHEVCFLPGTKVEVEEINYFTGGGATNTAVAFSRLGLKTAIVASIGKDSSGDEILNELRKERVNNSLIAVSKKFRTAYSAILTGFGRDRIILTYRGATAQLNDERLIKWNKLKTGWFYISSFHTKPKMLRKIMDFGYNKGIKIAFNPGKKEIDAGLKKLGRLIRHVNVLFLNREEALRLTGSADVNRNLKRLAEYCENVVITDGRRGVHATDGEYIYMKRPYNVKVLDVTGAGDAFNSAFTAALVKGNDIEAALDYGTANANSVIQHLGTKNILLNKSGIRSFLKKYERKRTRVKKKKI